MENDNNNNNVSRSHTQKFTIIKTILKQGKTSGNEKKLLSLKMSLSIKSERDIFEDKNYCLWKVSFTFSRKNILRDKNYFFYSFPLSPPHLYPPIYEF